MELQPIAGGLVDNDYNTSLCDCMEDSPSCVENWCCPYITVSQQYNMLNDDRPSPNWLMCVGMLFIDAMVTGGFTLIAASVANRSAVRRRFGLNARSACADFATAVCCRPCSDCQIYREMSIRNTWPGGFCLIDRPFVRVGLLAPEPVTMGIPVHDENQNLYPVQHQEMYAVQYNTPVAVVPPRDGYDLVSNKSPKECTI